MSLFDKIKLLEKNKDNPDQLSLDLDGANDKRSKAQKFTDKINKAREERRKLKTGTDGKRARRVINATGEKKTGSFSRGNLSLPGDKSGAYQAAKSDLEARKGFKDVKPGGLKADERNPFVKREVRKGRVKDVGGDIYKQPKVTDKDFTKSIKDVKKKYSEFDIRKMNFNNLDLYLSCVANNLKPFFIAATKNYKITMDAFSELNKKNIDMRKLGNLMNEHHFLLKNNLKITTKKIDKMIESTHSRGAYGSKIIGSGGEGCIVTLCEKKNVFDIIENLKLSGAKDAFEVRVC